MKRLTWILAASLAACRPGPVTYSGPVLVESAQLIPLNADVKVVADSEEPMFFAVGSYWLFHDGGWYRAPSIDGTWTMVRRPPTPVVQIEQPYAFTHYRDDLADDRTAALEVDNTRIPANRPPNYKFSRNPLTL